MIDSLPNELARELMDQRHHNRDGARVNESTLLPALERYSGRLYSTARSAIRDLVNHGAEIVIISGGYGLVVANESIGMYEQVFHAALWPHRLIERCLAGFADQTGVRYVIGVLSATTGYSRVFRRTHWPDGLERVILASPESTTGAMVKTPRAQGEWLAAVAECGDLPLSWSSSDGLEMKITHL